MNVCRSVATTITLVASVVCMDAHADYFFDVGLSANRIESRINGSPWNDRSDVAVHLGIGGRRAINERSDIGVRLELDSIDSGSLLTVRAFDYRRHLSDRLAYSVFAGAARLNLATPAYGWYLGAGIELKEITQNWNLGIDFRLGDKVARDNVLPGEPRDQSPDNFHDVTNVSIYLSRRF